MSATPVRWRQQGGGGGGFAELAKGRVCAGLPGGSSDALCSISGRGQDRLSTGSGAGASARAPLLPALLHHKILSVSWPDTANPRGLCRALQVRNVEPAIACMGRAVLG